MRLFRQFVTRVANLSFPMALAVLPMTASHADTPTDPVASPPSLAQLEQQAKDITQLFGQELKAVLQGTIMASGPVEAIKVCRSSAPAIANRLAQEQGWEVARTSHKVRNPDNAPDAWEQQILSQWQDKIARGAPVANLKTSAWVTEGGVKVYRYMSAIPTAGLCLNCHGSNIAGPVRSTLQDLYPQDQATGFKEGQLRGAFSLKKSF
ncbi:DUF3365 domain-containing protein [Ketobacter sp.]|uniref:Tll0287-like domain-containing protein n=1 Tax=Ketobacter sp. TaxID=2083498 RepID=UPI000F12728C|nr:DUF3365 domain-containing protein [Ketobacter sp.]RLT96990.1 MAG: DUF3365 domain-containing protein [Ketobacter sp.]